MAIARLRKNGGGYDKSLYHTPIYRVWHNMKTRCYYKKSEDYKNYGGRGIMVCDKWKEFRGFFEDMGASYKEGLSLDRVDVNGNYELNNCRWSTSKQQARNKRDTKFFEYKGQKLILTDWAKILGIKRSTLAQRYYVYGWSVDRVLSI